MTHMPSPSEFVLPTQRDDAEAQPYIGARHYRLTTRKDRQKSTVAAVVVHALVVGAIVINISKMPKVPESSNADIHFVTIGESIPFGSPDGDQAPAKPTPEVEPEPTPKPPADEAEKPVEADDPTVNLPTEESRPTDAEQSPPQSAEVAPLQGAGTIAFGAKTHGTGAGLDGDLMAAIGQAIATQISACWDAPRTNLPDDMVITMTVAFNPDGTLNGSPTITRLMGDQIETVWFPTRYEKAAIEAVERCAPLKLPSQYYPYWQAVDVQIFSSKPIAPPEALSPDGTPAPVSPNQAR